MATVKPLAFYQGSTKLVQPGDITVGHSIAQIAESLGLLYDEANTNASEAKSIALHNESQAEADNSIANLIESYSQVVDSEAELAISIARRAESVGDDLSNHKYVQSYGSSVSWTAEHNIGSFNLLVECYEGNGAGAVRKSPYEVELTDADTVTVKWSGDYSNSIAGRIIIKGI